MYFSPLCAATSPFISDSQFFPEFRGTRLFFITSLACLDVLSKCRRPISQLYTLRNDLTEMLFGLVNALKTFWKALKGGWFCPNRRESKHSTFRSHRCLPNHIHNPLILTHKYKIKPFLKVTSIKIEVFYFWMIILKNAVNATSKRIIIQAYVHWEILCIT
jgi:hypothetical protein